MIIPIDDKQRIRSSENSWDLEVIQIPKDADKPTTWKKIKFYTSLSSALQEACAREIRLHEAHGLVEAFSAATALTEKYSKILDGGEVPA